MTGARRSKEAMKNKKEKTDDVSAAVEENGKSELDEAIWSVITFDEVAASGLTYSQAAEKLEQLKNEKVSGLCVITDEAAARITKSEGKK